jgi:hypothetical protein
MEKLKAVRICFAAVFLFAFMACPFGLSADEKGADHKADRKAIEKELKKTLDMPVLKGDIWKKMTQDCKVAFIWGFGHVVAIEQHLMDKYPELYRDSFVSKVVEGMAGIPMNDVISRIDGYYDANPDRIGMPVMNVIWVTMIKPNIKTGIAGRPLKKDP